MTISRKEAFELYLKLTKQADIIWKIWEETEKPEVLQQYVNLIGEIRKLIKDFKLDEVNFKRYELENKKLESSLPTEQSETPVLQITFTPTYKTLTEKEKRKKKKKRKKKNP